jgi:hypothetical protein
MLSGVTLSLSLSLSLSLYFLSLANDLVWLSGLRHAPSIPPSFADFGYCLFPFFSILRHRLYLRPAQADCLVFPYYASSPAVEGFAPFPFSYQ